MVETVRPWLANHKKMIRGLMVCLILVFLAINMVGVFFGNLIYTEMSVRHSRLHANNQGRLRQYLETGKRDRQWQDVVLYSRFGYPLMGTFVPNPIPSEKTLIFLHGFTESRLIGLHYLNLYLNSGFNLLFFDSRAHGESGGHSVTWGVYEKHDLDQWVDWVQHRYPKGMIGVHGLSMGAATALLHAGLNEQNKKVSFYIADSAYSDFETVLAAQIRERLPLPRNISPRALLPYANLVAKLKSGFTFAQASPIRAAKNVTTPVLFIHGEADRLVPAGMSKELYKTVKGPKQIQLFPQAEHVSSLYSDRFRYRTVIRQFTGSIGQPGNVAIQPEMPKKEEEAKNETVFCMAGGVLLYSFDQWSSSGCNGSPNPV